jgi:diguanylate cyclase (GGDEF)-like protein
LRENSVRDRDDNRYPNQIMTDSATPFPEAVARRHRIRIAAYALACVPIGLHMWRQEPGVAVWILFVVQFLVYPHLLHWGTRQAANPRRTESWNMMVDAMVAGAWSAGLGFPLWISVALFLALLLNHAMTGGLQGIFIGCMAFLGGALASTAVAAVHVSTDTDGLVTLFSIIALAVYLSLIGIEAFNHAKQLHDVRSRLDRQNITLEEANTVLHSQTEKIRDLQEMLREQVNRDSLTGLFNRRYLEGTLERELARCWREGAPITVVMIDIDHFTRVNDTFGHPAGDEVLRAIGKRLLENARSADIVCRYGGEEFLMVMPKMPLAIALERARHLLKVIRGNTVTVGEQRIEATVSIGVATAQEHADSADGLLKCAEQALRSAKASGRNRVAAFGESSPRDAAA